MSIEGQDRPQIPVDTNEYIIGVENDQYGHINYKAYPGLFEPAQDAYMLARGLTFDEIEKDYGLRSVVPTYTTKVRAESFSGDRVNIETRIERVGSSSFTFDQSMRREETAIADFSMVVVMADLEGKPVSIPSPIREKLQVPVNVEE